MVISGLLIRASRVRVADGSPLKTQNPQAIAGFLLLMQYAILFLSFNRSYSYWTWKPNVKSGAILKNQSYIKQIDVSDPRPAMLLSLAERPPVGPKLFY